MCMRQSLPSLLFNRFKTHRVDCVSILWSVLGAFILCMQAEYLPTVLYLCSMSKPSSFNRFKPIRVDCVQHLWNVLGAVHRFEQVVTVDVVGSSNHIAGRYI